MPQPITKLKPDVIYQVRAECPRCKKVYDVDMMHVAQTCPYCYTTLKILPKGQWTIKGIILTQR